MKKWSVAGVVSGSRYLGTVEASSEAEAKAVAWDTLDTHVGLCHQCSGQIEDPEIQELVVNVVEDGA